jgi:hypothetical protein
LKKAFVLRSGVFLDLAGEQDYQRVLQLPCHPKNEEALDELMKLHQGLPNSVLISENTSEN